MNPNAPEHQPGVVTDDEIMTAFADKMFSDPDPKTIVMINKNIHALNVVDRQRHDIKRSGSTADLPDSPIFSRTPHPCLSNVGTGVPINSRQGLLVLDQKAGTPTICTDAYFQFICDYANLWHTKNTGIDHRSPGTSPRFFHLSQNFHSDLKNKEAAQISEATEKFLTREQFWGLRYLFIPISFVPAHQDSAHVAVCAVSPESMTVDYVCSGNDSGLPTSPRSDGSHCITTLFQFLAHYLGPTFIPSDWRFRCSAGRLQNLWRGDCGIYTVTHTLALAFGYTLESAFPKDHQAKILKRRKRYVGDILLRGFKLWDEKAGVGGNGQYYPLLDRVPSRRDEDGFKPLPECVLDALPREFWGVGKKYVDFGDKKALMVHCLRNAKLYPGFDASVVLGPKISFRKFLSWVEKMDEDRERIVKVRSSKRKRSVRVDLRVDASEHIHVAKTRRRVVWVK